MDSEELFILSDVQNEGTSMYVRRFESLMKFGRIEKLGSLSFNFLGERADRHFFIEIQGEEDNQPEVAFIETTTVDDAIDAIRDDYTVQWLLNNVELQPTLTKGDEAA
jgi:hypothetical protein